ncbi:phosphoglycerate mutase-like protein [Annulohypoxylon maeteangense]|uniref:phosphoglycerate mutase-like protein n=1 Tax=Annulohypoxylon maeteangense TaxID=1927788 RepID=UPI002008BF16|nr:phosphoglycerate mutase-like protein [Annulohypoxylon maeteangense]KAI0880149.1 phosphoglycerate mutase-like protein [Annulohypoxylon maeteangense]
MPTRQRGVNATLVTCSTCCIFVALLLYLGFALPNSARLATMRSWASLLMPLVTAVVAQNVDLGWYPPSNTSINNLTAVLDNQGVYGFIFNTSDTPKAQYGAYNWCNMPHVRKSEYVKPAAEYKLTYVEVIQRHHKRTPYASNAFPVESYHWNCDDQGLYYYGSPFAVDSRQPAHGFWKGYISSVNPYTPSGWIGTCQFPQITSTGLDDSWVHGQDLYGVYHDLLGFLPGRGEDWRSKVTYRVTQNVITSQVAGMLINGMWGTADSVPLMIQAAGVDGLEPQYTCSVGSSLFGAIKSSSNTPWQNHLKAAADLFETLDNISGVSPSDSGFHASFDHYFDNLSARQCHAKPLPCKLIDGVNSTTCVDQTLANFVYRMGQWEYSQMYRDAPTSLTASSTTYGVWVAELSQHLRDAIANKGGPIYFHNVAHDGSISRVLSILQIDVMVWPGMGSEIVFEVYKRTGKATPFPPPCNGTSAKTSTAQWMGTGTGGFFIRVLFGGKTLKSSNPTLGLLDMIPVETLLAYFDGLVGAGASLVVSKCNGTTPV